MPVFAGRRPIERVVRRGSGLRNENNISVALEMGGFVVRVGFDQVGCAWEEVDIGSSGRCLHPVA